jgi:hypothetical protein
MESRELTSHEHTARSSSTSALLNLQILLGSPVKLADNLSRPRMLQVERLSGLDLPTVDQQRYRRSF